MGAVAILRTLTSRVPSSGRLIGPLCSHTVPEVNKPGSAEEPMRISVVTPSFNQGRYLEECLLSVLGQGYPDLEYLVMDGGSTDESFEVIERHERNLAFWVSEPDEGQAAAINRGFEKASGDVLCWLNSDDLYLPGTLAHVASRLEPGAPQLLLGNCIHMWQGTGRVMGSDIERQHASYDLRLY